MITNTHLNGIYKDVITFFLKEIEKNIGHLSKKMHVNQSDLLQQINSAKITIESTSYYCIMKFCYNGVCEERFSKVIEMQLIRENAPPMVFHMYFTNNILYEIEYFKADSTEMAEDELFIGNVLIDVY